MNVDNGSEVLPRRPIFTLIFKVIWQQEISYFSQSKENDVIHFWDDRLNKITLSVCPVASVVTEIAYSLSCRDFDEKINATLCAVNMKLEPAAG